jgi:hypothetical protein
MNLGGAAHEEKSLCALRLPRCSGAFIAVLTKTGLVGQGCTRQRKQTPCAPSLRVLRVSACIRPAHAEVRRRGDRSAALTRPVGRGCTRRRKRASRATRQTRTRVDISENRYISPQRRRAHRGGSLRIASAAYQQCIVATAGILSRKCARTPAVSFVTERSRPCRLAEAGALHLRFQASECRHAFLPRGRRGQGDEVVISWQGFRCFTLRAYPKNCNLFACGVIAVRAAGLFG